MNLQRYQTNGFVHPFHNEIARLFTRDWPEFAEQTSQWVPAVDVTETKDDYRIAADVPGVDPKDIDITVDDGVLTLKGERAAVSEEKTNASRRIERRAGSFVRRFHLPDGADAEHIEAKVEQGVLR
ncbi:MAG: Hsp20/alpha crystallin family protein, partial [Salinisphaera sp.]|nr:Hsp20/alpha crystallin family protein [Salinisphaera sp.]